MWCDYRMLLCTSKAKCYLMETRFPRGILRCTLGHRPTFNEQILIKWRVFNGGYVLYILSIYLYIYLAHEQQRLVANSLHFSLSIAKYQASQSRDPCHRGPTPSWASCSAQVVLGCPQGRFQPGPGASPQRNPSAIMGGNARLHAGHMSEEGSIYFMQGIKWRVFILRISCVSARLPIKY